jgi:hypothetical protein
MQKTQFEAKSLGIVFDLSARLEKERRRIVDVIKKNMIDIVRKCLIDGEDSMYLYNPDLIDTYFKHGEQVCAIGNYNTDGYSFDLSMALRQTLYILMSEDEDFQKYLLFITDRLSDEFPLEKAFNINKKEKIECKFILVGVGDYYNKNILENYAKKENAFYIHLNNPAELKFPQIKEYLDGKIQSCCKTDERCELIQLSS